MPQSGQMGNKGGGRPSAYKEKSRAEFAAKLWEDEQVIDILKAKVQSGVYSAKDIFSLKVLTGNEPLMKELVKKLFPDMIDITSKGSKVESNFLTSPKIAKKIKELDEACKQQMENL